MSHRVKNLFSIVDATIGERDICFLLEVVQRTKHTDLGRRAPHRIFAGADVAIAGQAAEIGSCKSPAASPN